ncbi:SET protein [Coleophoma crateriformis]|uniref:SET protein n=1 Tax=Coleophoma crateriformis TaxID=565419 RepID=A0A3D8QPS3_9HELO|nr:SET protein [Coleophoma crateriformis]
MEIHQRFTEWAMSQGVEINGIAAHRFPGKGLGIIAERRHKAGDTLLTVPEGALRSVRTVPKGISTRIGSITVHGLLAADLTADVSPHRAAWRAVLPNKKDFEESVPLMWDEQLQQCLPLPAKKLLNHQKSKLKADWQAVSAAYPDFSKDDYLYNWLIVNTRTFYYVPPRSKKNLPRDDCMALNPFADYFNHADEGCEVLCSSAGYEVVTDKPIEKGAEVHISYGSHSNDFLLAEYGFILEENKWDHVKLDEYIIPMLSTAQKEDLEEKGFLGEYTLDKETICYRTEVALRIICLPRGKWNRFVNGLDDGEKDQPTVNKQLLGILESYQVDASKVIKSIQSLSVGLDCQRVTLQRRWTQIMNLLQGAIQRMGA